MKDLIEIECNTVYRSIEGYRMQRETGASPNFNQISKRWVLRDPRGAFVDYDQYSSDLAARNGFTLKYMGTTK
jgi:hypothetical protein